MYFNWNLILIIYFIILLYMFIYFINHKINKIIKYNKQ